MSFINRLEAKFGHHAIPGLMRIVAAFNAACYILAKWRPEFLQFLTLDPERILHGEVWRLFTYIFIPTIGTFLPDWFWEVMYILYLIWIGDGLERAWGSFKLNLYYLIGMIGTTIAAFFLGANFSGFMLNSSIFFAFARFYPEAIIYVFWVLPVKVKWMAWTSGAMIILQFLVGSWGFRGAVLAALSNYLLFFSRSIVEEAQHRKTVVERRARFQRDMREGSEETLHRCKVCGRTERIEPYLQFRVATDGEEYCVDHLPLPPARG